MHAVKVKRQKSRTIFTLNAVEANPATQGQAQGLYKLHTMYINKDIPT